MTSLENTPLHLHIISMHTSPLAQPGSGDAGGMNVYIDRSLRYLLKQFPQLSVEVFTLATASTGSGSRRLTEKIGRRALVHFVDVGASGLKKEDLPEHVSAFARGVTEQMVKKPDVVHAHYWLSGMVALEYATDVPLIQTMHTTAVAKNAKAGVGESHEPQVRLTGEQKIVDSGCTLVVNTDLETEQMRKFYDAKEDQLKVITPGVERSIFKPCPGQAPQNAGSTTHSKILFAGRPQPLKGPHLIVEAMALLPEDLNVSFELTGESGSDYEQHIVQRAAELQLDVSLSSPQTPRKLAEKFRTADIVVCPSSSETFGLVALEAQSAGACVLASDVDGLRSAVLDGETGILVKERTPEYWADALEQIIRDPNRRAQLGIAGAKRTAHMTWDDTAVQLMNLYTELVAQ